MVDVVLLVSSEWLHAGSVPREVGGVWWGFGWFVDGLLRMRAGL